MITLAAVMLSLQIASEDPLAAAMESFRELRTYTVTIRAENEEIKYFYKRPGFVRMEFVRPHRGAILVYNPLEKKARLKPFGLLKPLVITLSPDSRLIRSSDGHTIDRSDIGVLLETARELASNGKVQNMGRAFTGKKDALLVSVEGEGDFSVDGIHRYHLWLDEKNFLPIKASSFDPKGNIIEEVLMDDLMVDVELPDSTFDL